METRAGFHQAIEALNQEILGMGVRVEEALRKALRGLESRDGALSREVITEDEAINALEIQIQDRCIELIATEQPVALDLRRIVTAMKIVTQLERMGDHARHVAKAALRLAERPPVAQERELPRLGDLCAAMIRDVLTAFVKSDAARAQEVARADSEVDELHKRVVRGLYDLMMSDSGAVPHGLELTFVSRFLERIADHVTNIAEWIVYCETGKHAELNE